MTRAFDEARSLRPPAAGRAAPPMAFLGVVFCGGASQRMGRDKAALPLAGHSLLERATAVLDRVAGSVVLACGPEDRYAELGRPRVLDAAPDLGPLGGLSAALEHLVDSSAERPAADPWLAALACDMPRARAEVFEALLARARERDADACLLETDGGVEPLYAVYRGTCLAAVRAALAAGERRMISFHDTLTVTTLAESELAGGLRSCAVNVNTPSDYERELEVAR